MNKAIVVGAGIGGIATACRLAINGYDVKVFEASSKLGGKMDEFSMGDYRFDWGPSLFTLPQLVTEIFKEAGKNPEDYFQYQQKEVTCNYFWNDGTRLSAYSQPLKFAREVEQVLGVPAATVLDYLSESEKLYNATTPLFLEKSLHKASTYFNTDVLESVKVLSKLKMFSSLHEVNLQKLKNPKLVQLFDRYATYNGSSPYLTPATMRVIPHLEFSLGTYLPRKGMSQIPQSLIQLARELGVEFTVDSPVQSIEIQNDRAVGVRVGNQMHTADLVVSNSDVVPTYRKLLKDQKAPEKVLSQPRSSSAMIFYWGVEKNFSELDLHNIFFSEDYQGEFHKIFEEKTVGDDPTIYVNITSKEIESDAPKNGENWFVMINVPGNTGQDWESISQRIRTSVIKRLSKELNCDLEALIKEEKIVTPVEIEAKTGSFQGSLYGASSNNTMAAFLRHPNFSQKIKNLYFVGGSVHPGGGVPLCLLSAKITSQLVPDLT
ncbi:MAG: phytoene desaturase family protein [Schleiferiaceae bacterium]